MLGFLDVDQQAMKGRVASLDQAPDDLEGFFGDLDLDVRRNGACVRHFPAVRRSSHGELTPGVRTEGR